ncbi:unnamed protein product [Euphydryas editha]|uniref:DDE Tnp4 domain-containing protein n=1 Tax=Euphydryas editha TaxID=104508 RepID=A0AAU9TPF1_EUPED|nr:unnamed protein product [Euphydryas editha]
MAHCLKCSSALPEDSETEQLYFISNMSQDIIDIIEQLIGRQVPAHPLVCVPCWRRVQFIIENNNQPEMELQNIENVMELDAFKHTTHSSVHCFVPECSNLERHRVPGYLRKIILKTQKLYVSDNARVCQQHIITYNWDFISQYQFSNTFTKAEIQAMLLCFNEEDEAEALNFTDNMPDNLFNFWTGKTKAQFENLFEQLPSLNENNCKYPKQALILFLIKAHTGEPHDRLASLFKKSKTSVFRLLKNSREALLRDFVPLYLGINRLSREDLILKNLKIPEGLFGDRETRRPIVIFDGTYIYLQNSSNYMFQKQTYSLHKYRNLIKPFLLVAPDGHIIDVFGPYPATQSDSDIMTSLFQNENSILRTYFRPNDIFILDRGFRDSIPILESLGYNIYKPENILPADTQLTTINANKTRYVTLCRWVVEVVNGRFKNEFKLFKAEYFNLASTHLMDDFRICAALINAYHVKLRDRPDAELILNRAVEKFTVPNCLAEYVTENNINRRRAQFIPIDAQPEALDIFPQMTMSDLELFALGVYQIRQARSYFAEHVRQNGSFSEEIATELESSNVPGLSSETVLLRGRIKSRHVSNKIYYTYILIKIQGSHWDEKIVQYYCSCICGRRTVGCCTHVMTIAWYLGWARHQEIIHAPASFLNDILLIREDNE